MSFIEVDDVWKTYGDNVVLERVKTKVETGEFITIVGTSGCGKTTFLKMLLGTEYPTRGTIKMNDKLIPQEPGADRGIVFQKYSVFPHLTALQNLVLAKELEQSPFLAHLFGSAQKNAEEKAQEMLALVGLQHAAKQYPHELSGGMQQRLAIAQALMKQPKVLLLDEPFGALDPGIRADMHELILDIWNKTNVNIFMITHDLKEGFYLGTRLWVFDKIRHDQQAPNAYGATITYDIPVGQCDKSTLREIDKSLEQRQKEYIV
ncbi:ABC transporter ATP-binding protein [Kaarinaea lacus]